MSAYLNVETIRNAAQLINTALKIKEHTAEDIKFATVDWEDLIKDQPEKKALEKLTVQEAIYNNDKNAVNAFYSLVQDIDRHNRQHEASNHALAEKDAQIMKLQQKLASAELDVSRYKKRLSRLANIETPALSSQVQELTKKNKSQAQEILRIRNINSELLVKYDVEKRRQAIQVSELKTAILHARGLSTTISYGRPLNNGVDRNIGSPHQLDVNPQIIHNNKPLVNNSSARQLYAGSEEMAPIVEREYSGIATQLLELIERLMTENGKFSKLACALTVYLEKLNDSIVPERIRDTNGLKVVNPGDEIDTEKIYANTDEDVEQFEVVSTPLLKTIYRNHDAISTLVDMAVTSAREAENGDLGHQGKIENLKEENELLASSLQEALKALEDWRKYRKPHDQGGL